MRISSLSERREFYSREFTLAKIRGWFHGWQSPIVFAVIIGRHTHIAPSKYLRERARTIVIDEYEGLPEIENYLIDFTPESVYYDRNVYKDWGQARRFVNDTTGLGRRFGQELVFDIDPENFTCPIHGTLENKMRKHQGLSFCRLEFQLAREEAAQLVEILSRRFSQITLVYSGRGFHIHITDEETVSWRRKKRLALVRSLIKKGFVMDEWVPAGGMRLIRLPYSLNGLVSRVAIPLSENESGGFDPTTDVRTIPKFLSR
ncbi:MAG TPA: DNA primase [Candidatus Angelobacter sp.]|nr:DNA primase [Candidatus Angelobacter sp.]